jgi:hypothetical protein
MNPKDAFGPEYPAAAMIDGHRLPLTHEARWIRRYANADGSIAAEISKFMDGSASLNCATLIQEWSTWAPEDRKAFFNAFAWLGKQTDFPDMLRFLAQHATVDEWAMMALPIARHLPRDEAFDLLVSALQRTEPESAANHIQGIAATRHPQAETVLRDHLARLWSHPMLWENEAFSNGFAYGATCCMAHLLKLGVPRDELADQARALAAHPCKANQDSWRRSLGKYYPSMI